MAATVVDVLVHPGEFFAERDVGLRGAALVVVAAALLAGLTGVVIIVAFRRLLPPRLVVVAGAFSIVTFVVGGLVGWLVLTALLYALSWPLAEEGSFRALLAPVGWGMAPHVLTGLVVLVATLVVVSQLSAPTDSETAVAFARQVERGPLVALAAFAGTARATASGSLSQVQAVTGVASALWSGYVWVAAVERVRGLSRRAAVAVVVPVVVVMLLNAGI